MNSPIRTKITNLSNNRFVFLGLSETSLVIQPKGTDGAIRLVKGDVFSRGSNPKSCDDLLRAILAGYIEVTYDIDSAFKAVTIDNVLSAAEFRLQTAINDFKIRKKKADEAIKPKEVKKESKKETKTQTSSPSPSSSYSDASSAASAEPVKESSSSIAEQKNEDFVESSSASALPAETFSSSAEPVKEEAEVGVSTTSEAATEAAATTTTTAAAKKVRKIKVN